MVPVALLADIPLLMITLHRKLVERELMPLGVHLNVLSDLGKVCRTPAPAGVEV